jgi:predicted glycosyltransferase involved in capsule biosynthesis
MLDIHKTAWSQHPLNRVRYNLIDDGSPTPISKEFCMEGLSVYRIKQDIPWNIAGARNLGFHVAETEWVLSADIDHVISQEVLTKILTLDLSDNNTVYTFNRKTEDGYFGCDAIINILMSKRRYFEIGGYDEDYSGNYGREETFFFHCLKHHRVRIVRVGEVALPWFPRSGATSGLRRDKSANTHLFEKKMNELKCRHYKNGPILRFDWSLRT